MYLHVKKKFVTVTKLSGSDLSNKVTKPSSHLNKMSQKCKNNTSREGILVTKGSLYQHESVEDPCLITIDQEYITKDTRSVKLRTICIIMSNKRLVGCSIHNDNRGKLCLSSPLNGLEYVDNSSFLS